MDAFLSTFKNTTHSFVSFRQHHMFVGISILSKFVLAIDWEAFKENESEDIRFYKGVTFEECRLAYLADLGHAISDQNEHNAQMQEDSENTN